MERTETYWKAFIESIKLIHGLALQQEQKKINIDMWLNQIQSKAEFKAGKFGKLGDELGISQEFAQQRTESESLDYWVAVGDAAGLAKNFVTWKKENPSNSEDLNSFLSSVRSKAEAKLKHYDSPLIKELGIEFGMDKEASETFNAVQMPEPKPVVQPQYTPEPEPVVQPQYTPEPEPVVQPQFTPEPKPVVQPQYTPEPEPVVQPQYTPEPEPVVQPQFTPEPESEIIAEPELEYSKDIDIESDESSLIGALLESDDSEEDTDDDILSSSLRDALKMLKDEDDD
ncbi:MAG: hypothetical protein ACTSRU_14115 [Candidatus Hodarchaeales archaeon]